MDWPGYIGPIPFIVILTIVVLLISHIILSKTAYGRHIYAVGSNEEVAKLSGIRVNKIKTSVYMICAGLSALRGYASRLRSVQDSRGRPKGMSSMQLRQQSWAAPASREEQEGFQIRSLALLQLELSTMV